MTEKQWSDLGRTIRSFYTPRIKFPFEVVFYRYTDDTYSLIKAKYPHGPLVIAGHSFGGCRAVQVAAQFNGERTVDSLFLFDPVEITAWDKPNTKGFALTPNVADAVCFPRNAKEAPWPGSIVSGPKFVNLPYPGGHGDAVWKGSNIAMIAAALESKKYIVKVVVHYSDGTTSETT